MHYSPDLETFQSLAGQARCVPVFRTLVSDTLSPVTAYCRIAGDRPSFLFESVVGGEKIGRYSFLGSDPFLEVEAYGQRLVVKDGQQVDERQVDDPLAELEQMLKQFQAPVVPGLPRFCGGAVGYAGYDVVRYTEHLPNAPEDDRHLPDMAFAFYDRMVIFDQINKTVLVVVQVRVPDDGNLEEAYRDGCRRVDELCEQLADRQDGLALCDISAAGETELPWTSNFDQADFEAAVEQCKEYIRAGDVFQVVLSQRLAVETTATPVDIYRSLRVVNPSPFMFMLRSDVVDLIGSSPEIMVRVEDRETTIRPLAGTRKRGRTPAEDQGLADELLADPKERAEHVMLIDLARNDVGRVARFGTVRLSDVMVVERYSHVMHITSNVTGELDEGYTALDALRAGLPAGTVSGAPKVRAMQIIDELERHRRGPYAGAVGYLDYTGNMDTCIALRTIVLKNGTAYVQAGAGIVADSVPELEYRETLNKAQGLLRAIQVAQEQLAVTGRDSRVD